MEKTKKNDTNMTEKHKKYKKILNKSKTKSANKNKKYEKCGLKGTPCHEKASRLTMLNS